MNHDPGLLNLSLLKYLNPAFLAKRCISGPFYLYCLAGCLAAVRHEIRKMADAPHPAGSILSVTLTGGHVYWLNGACCVVCATGSLRT
ncbi:hypothetical protein KCP69_21705 [Salmonella enterica subsp. enterica]|nr:hypothetical protein KCP69_21705 [Salmonella enterica subsp. enterica]